MSKISNLKAYYNENMSWMWNFIMAESGAIFTFGKSRFGDNLPNKFWVRGDKAKSVACGDEHTALVTGKCVSIRYCEPTFIWGNFISRFTWDELVCVDHFFHDQALSTPFFLKFNYRYMAKTGLMQAKLDNEVLGNLAKLAHESQYSVRY